MRGIVYLVLVATATPTTAQIQAPTRAVASADTFYALFDGQYKDLNELGITLRKLARDPKLREEEYIASIEEEISNADLDLPARQVLGPNEERGVVLRKRRGELTARGDDRGIFVVLFDKGSRSTLLELERKLSLDHDDAREAAMTFWMYHAFDNLRLKRADTPRETWICSIPEGKEEIAAAFERFGHLTVVSVPVGATIEIDGVRGWDKTEQSGWLPAGKWKVKVTLGGKKETKEVKVDPQGRHKVSFDL